MRSAISVCRFYRRRRFKLYARIYQLREGFSVDDELTPFGIEFGGWFGCDNFLEGLAVLLQRSDFVADGDEHVTEFEQAGFVSDRTVAGNDNCFAGGSFDVVLCSLNHS